MKTAKKAPARRAAARVAAVGSKQSTALRAATRAAAVGSKQPPALRAAGNGAGPARARRAAGKRSRLSAAERAAERLAAAASKRVFVPAEGPMYVVRRSAVHGLGAFATRHIKQGEVIDEYVGDRITYAEADERYKSRDVTDNHTFLYTLDDKTVIDANVGGNDSRFLNHQCDANCAPRIVKRRLFFVATRAIREGEELGFSYHIAREDDDPENVDEIYACRCGAARCRGTMLWPPKRAKQRR